MWAWIAGALVALVAAGTGVVYWIRRDARVGATLEQQNATLELERQRRAAMERAAAADRAARLKEFDAKAAAADDARSAAELLRDTLSRS